LVSIGFLIIRFPLHPDLCGFHEKGHKFPVPSS
jgi:hypothetical protein